MKTTIQKSVAIVMMALLPVLFGAVQAGAVEYMNHYKSQTYQIQRIDQGALAPAVSFQSTSAYSGQWSTQESMLNADGSVNEGVYMGGLQNTSGRPRRSISNPDDDDDDDTENGMPLGDALLPLMLLACAYLLIRAARRRKGDTPMSER